MNALWEIERDTRRMDIEEELEDAIPDLRNQHGMRKSMTVFRAYADRVPRVSTSITLMPATMAMVDSISQTMGIGRGHVIDWLLSGAVDRHRDLIDAHRDKELMARKKAMVAMRKAEAAEAKTEDEDDGDDDE